MPSRPRSAKPSRALVLSEGLALRTGAAADILAPNLRLLFVAINP
jgi:hypothetical protein